MRQLIFIITLIVVSFCQAQPQDQLIKYLKVKFPIPDTIKLGQSFYDDKYFEDTGFPIEQIRETEPDFDNTNYPVQFVNESLAKHLPHVKFYTFSLLQRGCYGAERHPTILINNILVGDFTIQPQLSKGVIDPKFLEIVTSYKSKNSADLQNYLTNVAALLFSTIYVDNIMEKSEKKNIQTFYDVERGSSIDFHIKKNEIVNIIYHAS